MTKIYIDREDLLQQAYGNIYNTEYSTKITISVKNSVLALFKDIKKDLKHIDINLSNAQLFEMMVIEMYNSNKDQYK
jgi:hypothetical protein